LSITDAAANSPQTVALSGTGTTSAASLTPASLIFATQVIKTASPSQAVTLKSTGTTALNISQIAVTGQYTQLNNCSPSLAPGSTCTINVTFRPTTSGSQKGTLTVTDGGAGSPQSVTLTGTATVISFSTASLNFGSQAKGTSSSARTVTMTNVGSSAVSISKIGIIGLQESSFSETNNCGGSLAAGSNCTIAVTFTPQATGASNGDVSVSDNGGGSPQIVTLTGNGT
jgi:archaellum component FlaF (FlaF/FlaG flagellin family)